MTEKPLLDRARSAIPGRDHLAAALDAIATRKATTLAAGQSVHAPIRDAVDTIAGGSAIPEDLTEQIVALEESNQRAQADLDVHVRLAEELRRRIRQLDHDHADTALAVLAEELAGIVDEARPLLASLAGIDNPGDAIEHGAGDEWLALSKLARRHRQLRRDQATLAHQVLTPLDRPATEAPASTRALVDQWGTLTPDPDGTPAPVVLPGEDDPVARLRAVADPDVIAEVPTVGELLARRDQHKQQQRAEAERAANPHQRHERAYVAEAASRARGALIGDDFTEPATTGKGI